MTCRPLHFVLVTFGLGASSCDKGTPPPPSDYSVLGGFQTSTAYVITSRDTVTLRVQLAQNDEQRSLGLMDRTSLREGTGILFLYDSVQDSTASFWMYRTRIPLDIAFIDSTGTIASITRMVPCESVNPDFCPTYAARVRFSHALEVPAGYFERAGIAVGDRVHAYVP
jgi:uncharacterized protein